MSTNFHKCIVTCMCIYTCLHTKYIKYKIIFIAKWSISMTNLEPDSLVFNVTEYMNIFRRTQDTESTLRWLFPSWKVACLVTTVKLSVPLKWQLELQIQWLFYMCEFFVLKSQVKLAHCARGLHTYLEAWLSARSTHD